jgi:outer membrane protein assembly factor BamB
MRVIPLRPEPASLVPHQVEAHATRELGRLLLGEAGRDLPLPALPDVLSALLALAEGRRQKSLLPLGTAPAELVLVRRGTQVLVSYVLLEAAPDLRALDRPVPIDTLLGRCASIAERLGASDSDPTSRGLVLRLAERAREPFASELADEPAPVRKSGGALERPGPRVPIAFGFDAEIVPQADAPRAGTSTSDVHALLFRGSLWMWARGRRIPLVRGPIMLAIARMVSAMRALLEASESGRPLNVRLRAGAFAVGVRLEREGTVSLSLGSEDEGSITIPELRVEEAALPILRLASDVLRALVSVDRAQTRNLRVTSLRDEVRVLRRRVRAIPARVESIVHEDPERLRAGADPVVVATPAPSLPAPRILRFERRWEAEVEGLDAASTFLCGDRLVVATPRQTVALARDDGRVLWAHREPAAASFMTGTVLVRLGGDGRVALCDVVDGEPYAQTTLAPRVGGSPCGLLAGGGSIPPVAIVTEGRDRLSAVDLRNGELRWRFAGGSGAFALRRAGRIVLSAASDGRISAIDVASGELLWRFATPGRLAHAPAIDGDVVIAASGEPGGEGALHGIDLFSGRSLWRRPLEAAPSCAPMPAAGVAVVALGGPRRARLAAFSVADGELRWMIGDPGAALGAACLPLDRALLVNGSGGAVAVGLDDGQIRWRRQLSHPVADDVPRRLEAVLRGGALFVPSAQVHVLRPQDGSSIGEPLPCELVPDWMRVDERGWVYVAEESGHVRALAPRPHLSLVP